MPETFSTIAFYLLKFGPILIFLALSLGIIGLPIPDELLLISAGYLVAHQKLSLPWTVIAALSGSMGGITVSYLLGRLISHWFLKNYGKTFNITTDKIKLIKTWFWKIGKWVLIIGYFIPLFRHIVGFVAGSAKLDYKYFAIYAYTGAVLWVSTFLTIGYFLEHLKQHIKL